MSIRDPNPPGTASGHVAASALIAQGASVGHLSCRLGHAQENRSFDEDFGTYPGADGIGEAAGALGEIVYEEGSPLGADDVSRARDRAGRVVDGLHRTAAHADIVRPGG